MFILNLAISIVTISILCYGVQTFRPHMGDSYSGSYEKLQSSSQGGRHPLMLGGYQHGYEGQVPTKIILSERGYELPYERYDRFELRRNGIMRNPYRHYGKYVAGLNNFDGYSPRWVMISQRPDTDEFRLTLAETFRTLEISCLYINQDMSLNISRPYEGCCDFDELNHKPKSDVS